MYHVFYIFRVARENSARFAEIAGAAGVVYRKYGAIDSTIMQVTDAAARYGCLGLADVVASDADQNLFLGVDSFRDLQQFKELMPRIDADPEIAQLFQAIQRVVDLKTVVRWEADGPDNPPLERTGPAI